MYGNLGTAEVQRIKQLERENQQLKQLAGDQALAIQILQEHIKKKGY
jgi:putative transposase